MQSKPDGQLLSYVFGGRLPSPTAGTVPRTEYQVFLARHPEAAVWDVTRAERTSRLAGALVRRGQSGFGVAWAALRAARRARCFLASGEDIGLALALLARGMGDHRRIYIVTHGSFFGAAKFRALMRALRRDPNLYFLPLSESLATTLITEFGVPAGRVINTSYGVDTRFLHPAHASPADIAQPESRHLIVAAGAANRDYRLLIEAVSHLGAVVDLRIAAGSTWFEANTDLGERIPDHVRVEPCPFPALRGLLGSADFVVVPLRPGRHACGYAAIADAMAMGKAVIATRTEHASDLVVEGLTGLYVRAHDPAGLVSAIERLIGDPDLARRMGVAGRRRVEELFSLEAYVSRLEAAVCLAS